MLFLLLFNITCFHSLTPSSPPFPTLIYPLVQLPLFPLVQLTSFVLATATQLHMCGTQSFLGCNGCNGTVSNKCLETYPRWPYLPSSALGIESAIFMLHSAVLTLLAICLTFICSLPLPHCLHMSLLFKWTCSTVVWLSASYSEEAE